MIKLTLEEENFIESKIENGKALLEAQDWDAILDKLDTYEIVYGYISFEEGLNDNGIFVERLIDKIAYSNDD